MMMTPRSRPKIDRQVQDQGPQAPLPDDGKSQVSSDVNRVAKPKSKNEPTDRERALLPEQGGQRPRCAWRSFTTIDDDWTRRDRQRGRLKNALETREIVEAMEQTRPQNPEAVAQSKYEPTDYERAVLARQAQRLKDQVRVPAIRFVEDQRGGRREFDHPDQAIALALLNEAFGTADDHFTSGLLGYLCAALPVDENSGFGYPRADDLNHAISLIAAGKAVDESHAALLADRAVCRITRERLLHNVREPMRFDLSDDLRSAVLYYKDNPKGEIEIDNRPVLEFNIRFATKLMALEIELIDAANRHRASVESSRKIQQLSTATPVEASFAEIKLETSSARPEKANAARARRLNGSAVHKLSQKTDSILARSGNGHTPT
jgi:hypothetical protein